jgi:hypothetical protein
MSPAQWEWRKSSRSATSGDCVEIAWTGDLTAVRDSKNPTGGHLAVDPAFIAMLKNVR